MNRRKRARTCLRLSGIGFGKNPPWLGVLASIGSLGHMTFPPMQSKRSASFGGGLAGLGMSRPFFGNHSGLRSGGQMKRPCLASTIDAQEEG